VSGTEEHPPRDSARLRLIDREYLLNALDRAAAGRIAIVTAPAGSGKSTLLRTWADRRRPLHKLAFVQVQRGKQDAQLFWLAMLNAVRRLSGDPVDATSQAASPDFNGAATVDRILAELACQSGPVDLVIDDVHELNSAETFRDLTRLLENLPQDVHAILATRRDLPLRLHHLRLSGELAELREADLRFTPDETRSLLRGAGIALSDASVIRLYDRTEGWAAGLRLAVISMTGLPDPDRFVAEFSGSNRTVAEYLLAEMLERQPAHVQNVLLRTSILERVSGELADLLTAGSGSSGNSGGFGAERVLLDLEDANAFVVSLDPNRTWFRYHHLFADLLRLELRRVLPDEVRGLHRRAAAWFGERGSSVDAVRHLQAAGDWPEAASLFADRSFGMMLDGHEETIQTLLAAFPPRIATALPELSIVRTMVDLFHGRLDSAAAHLAVVDGCAASVPEASGKRLRAAITLLKLVLARRRGDLDDVLRHAHLLDSRPSGDSDEEIELSSDLRIVALLNLGTVEAWALQRSDAARHLREAADLARKADRPYLEVASLAQLAFAAKLPDAGQCRERCEEAIALAEKHGWGAASILAPALVTLACCMVWTGEFDDAERAVQRCELALQSDSGPGIGTLVHLMRGMLEAGRGRLHEAAQELATAQELQSRLPHPHALSGFVVGWSLATRARLGDTAGARATLDALAHQDSPLVDSGQLRNALATICLAEGDPAGALAAVAGNLDAAATNVTTATAVTAVHDAAVIEAWVLAGLAHRELGDGARAQDAIEHALELAEPGRLVLPFAMAGAGDLLAELPRGRSAHAALLTDILSVIGGSSPAAAPAPAAAELSPTELRVLRYLPTNLSRPEIAKELSVSVNTVNTHVRNIYAKLDATDRSSAVQRARELRLLARSR
jgi:LuxR family maltose regulon positive regulatory protein